MCIVTIVETAEECYEKILDSIMSRGIKTQQDFNKYWDTTCNLIALQCEAEGYPSHGSNYELRCEDEWMWLSESYPEFAK